MNWNGLELPKAYYQDEAVYIIHADCRDVLPLLPDKSIDLVLTDPPYESSTDPDDIFPEIALLQIIKPMKETATIYWFSAIPTLERELTRLSQASLMFQNIIVWNHPNTPPMPQDNYRVKFTPILYYTKSSEYHFDKDSVRQPYSELTRERWTTSPLKKNRKMNPLGLDYRGAQIGNVITISNLTGWNQQSEQVWHKWQKPVELISILIAVSSQPNNLILDPFLGSGTTAYCAKKLGRKCIGIEIEEKYCEISAKRCSQTVMKLEV